MELLPYYLLTYAIVMLCYLGKALLYLAVLVALYVMVSYLLPFITVNTGNKAAEEKNRRIFLDGNGVHIDYVFAREDLPADFLSLLTPDPNARYVAFGWGDQGFYLQTPTWAELKASVAIKAMLLPSPTAMHVTDHTTELEKWRPVLLTDTQLTELIAFVKEGFQWQETAVVEIPAAGYGDNDRFYQGTGNYHAVYTCNTWINTGLKKIGVRTGIWSSNQEGVLRYFPKN